MSGGASNDPFHMGRQQAEKRKKSLETVFTRWQNALNGGPGSTATEKFKKLHAALPRKANALESRVAELNVTIELVEKSRATFSHITDSELRLRKSFIQDCEQFVARVKRAMADPSNKQKIDSDRRAALISAGPTTGDIELGSLGSQHAGHRDNARFVRDEKANQARIMQEQDAVMDDVDDALDRLGQVGNQVYGELQEQEKMLSDLDTEVSKAQQAVDAVNKKLAKYLKTNDNCQLWTTCSVGCVMFLVIILFFFFGV